MDKEQEDFLTKLIEIIDWYNQPEKYKSIDENIIKRCNESRLFNDKNIIYGEFDDKNK